MTPRTPEQEKAARALVKAINEATNTGLFDWMAANAGPFYRFSPPDTINAFCDLSASLFGTGECAVCKKALPENKDEFFCSENCEVYARTGIKPEE